MHSFTPVLRGDVRRADVGLMYDPARRSEAALCARWLQALREEAPRLRVRRNYPYRGTADGFQPHLRRLLGRARFTAVEIEINQKHLRAPGPRRERLLGLLGRTLVSALDPAGPRRGL